MNLYGAGGWTDKPASEAEQFAAIDAAVGNTMLVFADEGVCFRYKLHLAARGAIGLRAECRDTRTGSGLVVMWRDRVPPEDLHTRLANCRWLLEEVLAGRQPRPVAGELTHIWGPRPVVGVDVGEPGGDYSTTQCRHCGHVDRWREHAPTRCGGCDRPLNLAGLSVVQQEPKP